MEADPDVLLKQLTLAEKISILAGADAWRTPAIDRLGVPAIKTTDGPNGARGASFAGETPANCFPCGTAIAASWDPELAAEMGRHLASEVRSKAAHVLLAPTVNLHRHPLAGRNFECYSEDPHLTARMAVAVITAVQGQGVGTAVKHFVANDSEFERFTITSDVDERTLRELYLVPFEAALGEAGSWLVMSAYNRLNGTYCSEHPWLLTTLLRDEWGWDGVVISDWGGTHSTADAATAGLDWEMPGPPLYRGARLAAAVEAGEVSEDVIDEHTRRMLVLAARTGADAGDDETERWDDSPALRGFLRRSAAASIVVLRNEAAPGGGPVLPLDAAAVKRVAVVGPNGAVTAVHGGGSAQVSTPYEVSVAGGLAARVGLDVVFEEGCLPPRPITHFDRWRLAAADGMPGVDVEYFAGDGLEGTPVRTARGLRPALTWSGEDAAGAPWSARMRFGYSAGVTGEHALRVATAGGGFRLRVDGEVVVDEWERGLGRTAATGTVPLDDGVVHAFELELRHPGGGPAGLGIAGGGGLNVQIGPPRPDDLLDRAVAAATAADAVVVVVGLNPDLESEGKDRRDMELPAGQVELIEAVAAANPRCVVAINAGSPVAMDWEAAVPAVVQMWYPGQEAGHALADILFGDAEPSGRLPMTIPARLEDTPAYLTYPGERGHVRYGEGLFIGYRWYDRRAIAPRYPFGHGLSYTTFSWGPVAVDRSSIDAAGGAEVAVAVTVPVRNTGARRGREVVQVYVQDLEATVIRPDKELRAFASVWLEPGESSEVRVTLDRRAFAFWDPATGEWTVEPGEFVILAGASATDIRGRAEVTVTG